MFACRPLILKVWILEANLERRGVDKVPVWISIPNLSLQIWNKEMFSKIVSYVGNPLLSVEVDVEHEQPDEVPLVNERKETFMKKVIYEFKPLKCMHYCVFGHSKDHCKYGGKKKRNKKHEMWVEKQSGESRVEEVLHSDPLEHDAIVDTIVIQEKECGPTKQIMVSNPFEVLAEEEQGGGSSAKVKSGNRCVRTSVRVKQVPQIMKRTASPGVIKKAINFGHRRSGKSQEGDFNIIISVDEAKGGKARDKDTINDFNESLSIAGLINFPSEGCRFT
ncbi:hypothetical protein LIER_30115 [Lithospermum erythrorhizon]|uniref:DUF4283 domain-containing protein n=1 Tax=Lithospermum erythrorhizon TaxID=34254 RepID=A0AAV3RRS3_LITER